MELHFNEQTTPLLVTPSLQNEKQLISLLKPYEKSPVCCITLNKASSFIIEQFQKEDLHLANVFFVDAVSILFKDLIEEKNSLFVTPNDLVELSIAIDEVSNRYPFSLYVVDSLSSLFIYHKQNRNGLAKFLTQLTQQIRTKNSRLAVFCLEKDLKEPVLEDNMHLFSPILMWDEHNEEWSDVT